MRKLINTSKSSYLSNKRLFPCLHSLLQTQRDVFEDLNNFREFFYLRVFRCTRLCKHRKQYSIAFMKYFSKLIRQMKGNFLYLLLDTNTFSQYRFGLWAIIFPTSQSKRAYFFKALLTQGRSRS